MGSASGDLGEGKKKKKSVILLPLANWSRGERGPQGGRTGSCCRCQAPSPGFCFLSQHALMTSRSAPSLCVSDVTKCSVGDNGILNSGRGRVGSGCSCCWFRAEPGEGREDTAAAPGLKQVRDGKAAGGPLLVCLRWGVWAGLFSFFFFFPYCFPTETGEKLLTAAGGTKQVRQERSFGVEIVVRIGKKQAAPSPNLTTPSQP